MRREHAQQDATENVRRWTERHPEGGRLDINGVEWFACDPYPTWYRLDGGRLITEPLRHRWADGMGRRGDAPAN